MKLPWVTRRWHEAQIKKHEVKVKVAYWREVVGSVDARAIAAEAERDSALAERDAALERLDAAEAERDAALDRAENFRMVFVEFTRRVADLRLLSDLNSTPQPDGCDGAEG